MGRLKLPRGFARRGAQIASLAALVAVGLADGAAGQGEAAPVGVARTERSRVTETAPVLARLVAPTQARIATRIAGIVDDVFVSVGDRVAKGDLIAHLDAELLHISRDAAEASLAQARAATRVATANLEMARQAFTRMESLQSSVAFSRARFEDLLKEAEAAKASLAESEARAANASAALAEANYNLRNTEIKAAVSGVVMERTAEPGAYLRVGDPIATLLNDEDIEIEADVPTEVVSAVTPGLEIAVTLDDGTTHSARVRALIPTEQVSTRTRPVRLVPTFSDLQKPLAAGQTATIHIPYGAGREVVTVPKDALVQASGGWIVFAAEDGKAVPRPVTIGTAVDDRFEVLTGLEPGILVVVRGNERLRPGQAILYPGWNPEKSGTGTDSGQKTSAAPRPGGQGG